MNTLQELLLKTLKTHNQSVTMPRIVVFDVLSSQKPQTIKQIIAGCGSKIDRASIYRTLTLFEKIGVVHRLQIGWKHTFELSDDFHHHSHHHHLTCSLCHRVMALPEDYELEKNLERLAASQEFHMQSHQLEIQGVCNNCRKL